MLGDELRGERERAGLSQQQVAAKAGITREYLSEVERENKSPTVKTLLRICRAIGCSAGQVLVRVEASVGDSGKSGRSK